MKGSVKHAVLFVSLIAGLGVIGSALEFSADQQKFWAGYKNLLELNDLRGVNQHVAKDPRMAEGVLDEVVNIALFTGNFERLQEAQSLARGMDEHFGGSRFLKRLEYAQNLEEELREKRQEALNLLAAATQGPYQKAAREKDAGSWRRALAALEESLQALEAAKDMEWLSYCRYRLGICHENLGEYMPCVVAFDKAMDEWLAAGRPKDVDYSYMVERRRELIEKGFDPAGPEIEGTPAKNTGTSYAEGSQWMDWTSNYKAHKSATQYPTPSPMGGGNIMLWRQFTFKDGDHPLGIISSCEPFGSQLRILRDGSSAMMDVDDDGEGDLKVKIIDGKANAAEVVQGKGKAADRYAVYLLSIGQSQSFLGYDVNYSDVGVYRPACYREVKLLDQTLLLIDDNCSGTFGDPREVPDGVMRGSPIFLDNDALVIGRSKTAVPYSDFIYFGDKLHRFKVADPQAKKVRTRELVTESGQVKIDWKGPKPPTSLVIREIQEFQGAYFDVAGKKPVTVPVGKYEVAGGKIESGSKSNIKQAWIFKGKSRSFEVKPGEVTVLEMGAPYNFEFRTKNSGKKFTLTGTSLTIYDRFDCLIGRIYDEVPLPSISVKVDEEKGATLVKNKQMKRAPNEAFYDDYRAAWFPADFEVDKSADAECVARLTLKKHGLLGGPFDTRDEWR
jgi:hypothetical protein